MTISHDEVSLLAYSAEKPGQPRRLSGVVALKTGSGHTARGCVQSLMSGVWMRASLAVTIMPDSVPLTSTLCPTA